MNQQTGGTDGRLRVEAKSAPRLTCRDMALTDEDCAILMRNPALAHIGIRDADLAFQSARYQIRTKPFRDANRRNGGGPDHWATAGLRNWRGL
jgi:hypothetical protein